MRLRCVRFMGIAKNSQIIRVEDRSSVFFVVLLVDRVVSGGIDVLAAVLGR